MTDKPLTSEVALAEALGLLVEREPKFGPVIDEVGPIPLRSAAPDFEGLAQIVCGQQVSKASAQAIWGRFRGLVPEITAQNISDLPDEPFIKAGFSRPKQRTIRAVAAHILETGMDMEALIYLSADQAIAQLTALKGIGPWTAECYLLFCGGHRDVFPAGDIALQQAALEIFNMRGGRPSADKLRRRARQWRPVRAAAARVLYAHYNFHRSGNVEAI
jgi:DNA-3-methyladenine glycosylase II